MLPASLEKGSAQKLHYLGTCHCLFYGEGKVGLSLLLNLYNRGKGLHPIKRFENQYSYVDMVSYGGIRISQILQLTCK